MFEKSGIVVLNKPCGISSNSAVGKVKRALSAKKCGHLGTLDVEASGVLLVTVGSATKLFDMFLQKEKSYVAEFEFGIETDTLDATGNVVREDICDVKQEELELACAKMTGKQPQMPPQYSAKKVGGKVAYAEARAGRTVELKPKEIEIFEFSVLEKVKKNVFKVSVTCSSGTYIRSLARDVAKRLGTCGHMKSLVRTQCGGFSLENSATFDDVLKGFIPSESLFDYEKITISESEKVKLFNGQKISTDKCDGIFKLFCESEFLGLAEVKDNLLKLKLRLN